MGYHHRICIGYRFRFLDLRKQFVKIIDEVFHMEKRFNPKTGERVKDVKFIDKSGYEIYKIGEFEYKSRFHFCETIAATCRCDNYYIGYASDEDEYGDEYDDNGVVFSIPTKKKEIDTGRWNCGGSFLFKDVAILGDKLEELKGKLESLGLKPGEPEVILCWLET